MLTQEQKNKLEPLTKHERFGKLLIDAIKTWNNEARPTKGSYGVMSTNKDIYDFFHNDKSCCLIGASLYGKCIPYSDGYSFSIYKIYSVSDVEMNGIIHGFDSSVEFSDFQSEAYKFGNDVAKIVLC